MAIRLEDEYGALATPADANYPGGSFLNDPTGTGTAGTPLEKTWADDLLGARDAVLQAAGVGYSGAPDTASTSDFLDALYNLFVKIDDAVSAATANKVVRRDANGRFKAAAPSASDDVALKSTVDTAVALRALLAGSSGQQFSVAAASSSAHATNLGQFPKSLTTNGYQKLPGGLIMQWGSVASGGAGVISFPIPFTTACFSVQAQSSAILSNGAEGPSVTSITTTGFTLGYFIAGASYTWFAIGY